MSFVLKLFLIDLTIFAVLILVFFLLKKKIRPTRNGFIIRRKTFKGEGGMMTVADSIVLFGKGISRRSLLIKGGCCGSVPLKKNKDKLVYASFCQDFLSLIGEKNIKNTLTLGGGAGAMPFYTANRYNAVSDVIEINKACIEVSEKYFMQGSKVNYICGDALCEAKKLKEKGKKYQFVFCDLFVDFEPAKIVFEKELMTTVSALLTDDGIFVMNGTSQNVKTAKEIIANMESAFAQTAVFVRRNMFVLCASNRTDIELIKAGNKQNGMFPVYPKTPFVDE